MSPNSERKRAMLTTAADSFAETRPLVAALVERAERQRGSRMAAYEAVARSIGRSSDWVRKMMGRRVVLVGKADFDNIVRAYRAACERLEAEAELEKQRFIALGRAANAVAEGMDPTSLVDGGKESPRTLESLVGEGAEE